jgi:hypothetical protein
MWKKKKEKQPNMAALYEAAASAASDEPATIERRTQRPRG